MFLLVGNARYLVLWMRDLAKLILTLNKEKVIDFGVRPDTACTSSFLKFSHEEYF